MLETIKHPHTGAPVSIRTRTLKHVDGTYVLEGTTVITDGDESAVPFPESDLGTPGWPAIHCYKDNLRVTQHALRLLVALLYGARLDCSNFGAHLVADGHIINSEFITVIVTTCAIAEYYGCLPVIGRRILCILKSLPAYWEAVADDPLKHAMLAAKLEDAEIYQDALRHLIAQAYLAGYWDDVVEVTGWSEADLRDYHTPQLEALGPKVQQLREDLHTLQLGYVRGKKFGGGWYSAYTKFLDAMRLNPADKLNRVHFLGGAIWGEWLTYQISGEVITDTFNCYRGEKAAG